MIREAIKERMMRVALDWYAEIPLDIQPTHTAYHMWASAMFDDILDELKDQGVSVSL